jgi:hypothetical protein
MADRLAYEQPNVERQRAGSKTAAPPNRAYQEIGPIVDRLATLEARLEGRPTMQSLRRFALIRLHESYVQQFIESPGFGVSRHMTPRKEDLVLPVNDPIDLSPADPMDLSAEAENRNRQTNQATQSSPANDELQAMHELSIVDFVNEDGFGYIVDRGRVAGFQEHQFRSMPELSANGRDPHWRVERLELVSLLKFAEPAVYLSDHLPRMDELRDAPTRPLHAFEKASLLALRNGEELKVESEGDRMRMLGSIRAVKRCLSCHSGERGELLGAFSYRLRRQPPAP